MIINYAFTVTPLPAISSSPSVVGTGISAALIEYNKPLVYLGIAIIFMFNGITIYKLRKERTQISNKQ